MAISTDVPATIDALNLTVNPEGVLDSGPLREIVDFWESLRQDGRLPSRTDFKPEDLRNWLSHILLVDIVDGGKRFRWRLLGTAITDVLQRDNTGKWFDEIYKGEQLAAFEENYALAFHHKKPFWFQGTFEYTNKEHISFRSVHLPLASNGVDVDMVLVLLQYD